MRITPIDIQEQRFKVRFRGFDVQEVDSFLEYVAKGVQTLQSENQKLAEENKRLTHEVAGLRQKEQALGGELEGARKLLAESKTGTRKSADLIMGEAEVQASKMLSRAHTRLSQLHEDIADLKRQRQQIEEQVEAIVAHHSQLLSQKKEDMKSQDDAFDASGKIEKE